MDFEPTDEQRSLKDAAREFAAKKIAPFARKWDEAEAIPPAVFKDLAAMGYYGLLVPEEFGGLGLEPVGYVGIMEELAYASAAVQVGLSVHNSLVCESLLRYGTKEQKDRFLPKLASGELVGAYSLTEPSCGSDAGAVKTRAELKGGHYLVNGEKSWVTNAGRAGLFVVFVSTDPAKGSRGISCLLVERAVAGLSVGEPEKKLGIRASDTRSLHFKDCKVPADCLLGRQDEGFGIALRLLDNGRIAIAAQAVGVAQAALDAARSYAKMRVQFGRPIDQLQATQFKLADMATDIDAARLLTLRAAALKTKGAPCSKEASMAKLFASRTANKAAYDALQIHGALGFSRESDVERFFRDARVTEIYEGTSEVQRIVIARELNKVS